MNRPHGFSWPTGMPACGLCGLDPNDPLHVTPGPSRPGYGALVAAVVNETAGPRRSHSYVLRGGLLRNVLCTECRAPLQSPNHPVGAPSRYGLKHSAVVKAAEDGPREQAFVATIGDRIVLATRGRLVDHLPETLTQEASQKAGAFTPPTPHMWVIGRYVEADRPNRNSAYWATEDLELGHPSVAQGPINWLHEEKHIIGTIAHTELVAGQKASDEVGNHIVALGAIWPWLWPNEARIIADASSNGELWYSMECISRAVACLADGCEREMAYVDYMRAKDDRCEHMKDGAPRRFVDPVFLGAGIIVPPVRPGWARADARVLMPQAAALVEKQAAALEGLSTEAAETLVATLIASVEEHGEAAAEA